MRNTANPSLRSTTGQFLPGRSGNPSGRPLGARNRASRLGELLDEGESAAIVRAVVERALAGDWAALRACFSRLVAPVREAPVEIDLPPIACAEDLEAAGSALIAAVAAGDIAPGEAQRVMSLLTKQLKLLVPAPQSPNEAHYPACPEEGRSLSRARSRGTRHQPVEIPIEIIPWRVPAPESPADDGTADPPSGSPPAAPLDSRFRGNDENGRSRPPADPAPSSGSRAAACISPVSSAVEEPVLSPAKWPVNSEGRLHLADAPACLEAVEVGPAPIPHFVIPAQAGIHLGASIAPGLVVPNREHEDREIGTISAVLTPAVCASGNGHPSCLRGPSRLRVGNGFGPGADAPGTALRPAASACISPVDWHARKARPAPSNSPAATSLPCPDSAYRLQPPSCIRPTHATGFVRCRPPPDGHLRPRALADAAPGGCRAMLLCSVKSSPFASPGWTSGGNQGKEFAAEGFA